MMLLVVRTVLTCADLLIFVQLTGGIIFAA